MIIISIFNKFTFTFAKYFLFLLFFSSYSKNIAQSAIVSGGFDIANGFGSISSSIGNIVYKSNDKTLHISEGVEHAFIINEINTNSNLRVAVYPNPTTDLVYFKVENLNYQNLTYKVYDISGNLLKAGSVFNLQSSISIGNFTNNIFIIKLYRGNTESQSFKVYKLN